MSAKTNNDVIKFIIKKINLIKSRFYKNKKKLKILILGVSYKKNVDDLRESSSVRLIKKLKKENYQIDYSDPFVKKKINIRDFNSNQKSIRINKTNLSKYDISILMTDHDKFDYKKIYNYSKRIIDCRGKFTIDEKVFRAWK